MDQILTAILVALIGAIATVAAAVVVEVIKHQHQAPRTDQAGSLLGSIGFSVFGLIVLIGIVSWIGFLLLRPMPTAQILKPEDYNGVDALSSPSTILVEYTHIPSDHYIWVVVRDPRVRPMRMAYPQLSNGLPTPVQGDGRFETTISLGGPDDSHMPYNVVVMLLDEKANGAFLEYAQGCIEKHLCGGISLPYPGAEILDFVTIVRQ
ncbi:MAG: hypothetical protein JNL73_03655 [Anaerolineales bacterium]|nr:hypothetical protein [Anaerolineales bacterium]